MNTMKIQKVVPVVLRVQNAEIQILVFRHPLAGIQIVKGTVELNEILEEAALRELFEESGIKQVMVQSYLGIYFPKETGLNLHVFLCEVHELLAETWTHFCLDDGGLGFQFFWHPLFAEPTDEWHPIFQDLLYFIQTQYQEDANLSSD